ncbi:Uncharacterized protein APZ42_001586, partial [Daphnia magna]
MSNPNRRDHLTDGMIYWNQEKECGMAKQLAKFYNAALDDSTRHDKEFEKQKQKWLEEIRYQLSAAREKLLVARQTMDEIPFKLKKLLQIKSPTQKLRDFALVQSNKLRAIRPRMMTSFTLLIHHLFFNFQAESIIPLLQSAIVILEKSIDEGVVAQLPKILEQLRNEASHCHRKRITKKTPLDIARKSLEATHVLMKNLKNRLAKEAGNNTHTESSMPCWSHRTQTSMYNHEVI